MQKERKQELKEAERLSQSREDRSADEARKAAFASSECLRGHEARTCMLVCQAEAGDETAQEGSSRPQEVAAPIAAKRGKVEGDGGKGDLQAAPRGRAGHPCPTTQGDYQFRG